MQHVSEQVKVANSQKIFGFWTNLQSFENKVQSPFIFKTMFALTFWAQKIDTFTKPFNLTTADIS